MSIYSGGNPSSNLQKKIVEFNGLKPYQIIWSETLPPTGQVNPIHQPEGSFTVFEVVKCRFIRLEILVRIYNKKIV